MKVVFFHRGSTTKRLQWTLVRLQSRVFQYQDLLVQVQNWFGLVALIPVKVERLFGLVTLQFPSLNLMNFLYLSLVSVTSSRASGGDVGSNLTPELELQSMMSSESFQNCLQIMERVILANSFQSKFASYRLLPHVKGNLKHTYYSRSSGIMLRFFNDFVRSRRQHGEGGTVAGRERGGGGGGGGDRGL